MRVVPCVAVDLDDTAEGIDLGTLDAIKRGVSDIPDVEAADRLTDRVVARMISVATDGPRIDTVNADFKREYRALSAVLKRLDIKHTNDYSDLWLWHGHWQDELPTYASRRAAVAKLYAPVREALDERSTDYDGARPVDDGPTGWAQVDARLGKLRRMVRESRDVDDFKAVGHQCVSVMESLSELGSTSA